MTAQNPLIVRYDIGFQLSFAAVVGLALFAEDIESVLAKLHIPQTISALLAATLAAQLTTWTIIAYHFGSVSLYSPLANLLIGPVIPLLTLAGIPFTFIGMLTPSFASWLSSPFELLLRYVIAASHVIGQLPYATITLEHLPVLVIVIYYGVLGLFILLRQSEKKYA